MDANIYHRFLKIPVEMNIDLFQRRDYDPNVFAHIALQRTDINPEIFQWFERFEIHVHWIEAFYTPPNGGVVPIHADTEPLSNVVKVNWSFGAPGSEMIWWKVKNPAYLSTMKTQFNDRYVRADRDHCDIVYRKEISRASLVNVGQLHSAWNPTPHGRWTLSLPIVHKSDSRRVDWFEALDLFKSHHSND